MFIYGAMTVYTLAFITFAVSLAASRGQASAGAGSRQGASGRGSRGVVGAGFRRRYGRAVSGHARQEGVGAAASGTALRKHRHVADLAGDGAAPWRVVLRGLSAGRVPWGNMYEFSITAALAVSIVFLGLCCGAMCAGWACSSPASCC